MASCGLMMPGSGTFSTRTSSLPHQHSAFIVSLLLYGGPLVQLPIAQHFAVEWFHGADLHGAAATGLAFRRGQLACFNQCLEAAQIFANLLFGMLEEHHGQQLADASAGPVVFEPDVHFGAAIARGRLELDRATMIDIRARQ